jgi:hypothetical protein
MTSEVFNFFSLCPLNRFLDSKPYSDKLVIFTPPNYTVFLKEPHPYYFQIMGGVGHKPQKTITVEA